MTALRERMIEDLGLHGLSEQTKKLYVAAVQKLAEHYHKSPDQITDEELREYFLYLSNVQHVSASTLTVALCGIRFFYDQTLHQPRTVLQLVRPPHEHKLPIVLSVEEVREILGAVNFLRYKACLDTIYACGLRIQERVHLQVKDIDAERGVIHIRNGKGNKDRYVPLPQPILKLLRRYWVTHRHPIWIFPSHWGTKGHPGQATHPMHVRGVQRAFQLALQESGIQKEATVHSLRHTAAGLVNELLQAHDEHRLHRFLAATLKLDLVVLDELGFIPFSQNGAQALFTFCSELYERLALIITTNLKFADWVQIFGDERLTAALLDRLTHHAQIVELLGESYRFRQRTQDQHVK